MKAGQNRQHTWEMYKVGSILPRIKIYIQWIYKIGTENKDQLKPTKNKNLWLTEEEHSVFMMGVVAKLKSAFNKGNSTWRLEE